MSIPLTAHSITRWKVEEAFGAPGILSKPTSCKIKSFKATSLKIIYRFYSRKSPTNKHLSYFEMQCNDASLFSPYLFFYLFFLAQNCSGLRTCSQCLEQPECGWCGDPSSTGKGLCMEGSYRGPMKRPAKQGQPLQAHHQPQDMSLEPSNCPREKGFEWAFIQCPGKGFTSCLSY